MGVILAYPPSVGEELRRRGPDMRRSGGVFAGRMHVFHQPQDGGEHVPPFPLDVHGRPPDFGGDLDGPVRLQVGLETFDDFGVLQDRQGDVGRDSRHGRRKRFDDAGDVDDEVLVGFLDLEAVHGVAVEVGVAVHPDGGQDPDQMEAELLAGVVEGGHPQLVHVVPHRQRVAVFGPVQDTELHRAAVTVAAVVAVRAASRRGRRSGYCAGSGGSPRPAGARTSRKPPARPRSAGFAVRRCRRGVPEP